MYYKLANEHRYFADLQSGKSLSGSEVGYFPQSSPFILRALANNLIVEATKEEYEAYVTSNVTQDDYQAFLEEKRKKELIQLEEEEAKEYAEYVREKSVKK